MIKLEKRRTLKSPKIHDFHFLSIPCVAPTLLRFFLTFVYANIKIVNLQFGSEYSYANSFDF